MLINELRTAKDNFIDTFHSNLHKDACRELHIATDDINQIIDGTKFHHF